MTTAILKNLQVKRLISRAITPLHENVLEAIGVDEIVHPEEETAEAKEETEAKAIVAASGAESCALRRSWATEPVRSAGIAVARRVRFSILHTLLCCGT